VKQSTVYWIWLVGGLVWLVNSAIQLYVGQKGHALITVVVALLFFGAAVQSRRRAKLSE
jgi:hypothetical protein